MRVVKLSVPAAIALLVGCHAGVIPAPSVPVLQAMSPDRAVQTQATRGLELSGTVAFPAQRQVQATAADVINAATVSLVDTSTNTTVATTVTNPTGGFTLSLNGFSPAVNTPYLLDAMKGLNNHRPGNNAPRFRTFVMWDGSNWQSVSTPAIVINAFTTSVAVISGLDSNSVPPASTMGKVNVSVNPPGLNANPVLSGHSDAQIIQLATDITSYVSGDLDPVASVNQFLPTLGALSASSGKPTDVISLTGTGFSPLVGGNTVRFNGTVASVLSASPTRLIVAVPTGATTGNVTVQTTRGTTTGLAFTVTNSSPVIITAITPSQAGPGSTVTIYGSGFSTTASQNAVSFNGTNATPTFADANSLVVTVPTGATSGVVRVTAPSGTSNRVYFTVPLWITSVFPDRGTKGQEVTVEGGNFTSNTGSVTFAGVGGTIRSWADTQISVTAPAANTGPLTVNSAGSQASWPSFTMLAGNLGAFSTVSRLNVPHYAGWSARIGRYYYVGGGYDNSVNSWSRTSVERAPINTDGTLGAFTVVSGVNMVHAAGHSNHAQSAAVIGPYAYVFGGYNGGNTNTVQRATIFSDGTISNFAQAPVSLAQPCHCQSSIRVSNYVYVVAGHNGSIYMPNVQRATINPDGTLGSFATTNNLVTGRYCQAVAQVGNYLYVFGGYNSTAGHMTNIERAPINADGTLGAFSNYGNMPVTFYGGQVAVVGDFIYFLWGYNGSAWTNLVYRAPINADGSIGSITSYSTLSSNQVHAYPPLVVGGRLYSIVGHNGSAYVTTINEAPVQ